MAGPFSLEKRKPLGKEKTAPYCKRLRVRVSPSPSNFFRKEVRSRN